MAMASTVAAVAFACSPASKPGVTKSAIFQYSSSSLISSTKTPTFHLSSGFPLLGLSPFSPWSGLKHLGISFAPKSFKLERKGRCKGMVVYASLFGVGAPEALVIGVVALLVFGPKGLAEVARNLGKTLRAFQPTIRELQEVSREFKSTLEKEIGLDEISGSSVGASNANKMDATSTPSSSTTTTGDSKTTSDRLDGISSSSIDAYNANITGATSTPSSSTATTGDSENTTDPNGPLSPTKAYTSEELLKITEEQLKLAAEKQGQISVPVESQLGSQTPSQSVEETAPTQATQQPQSETQDLVK